MSVAFIIIDDDFDLAENDLYITNCSENVCWFLKLLCMPFEYIICRTFEGGRGEAPDSLTF